VIGSSLKADAVAHTSGRSRGRAIPRRESEPEADILVDRPLSGPERAFLWKFDQMRPMALAALSPGDRFTTRLTYRHGMVLAQGRPAPGIDAVTLVKWSDTQDRAEVKPSVLVTPGWWTVVCLECGYALPHSPCPEVEVTQ
jgi:hypothetical protein